MASIVWFEIPADNVERAKNFYGALFGWKIKEVPRVDGILAHRHRRSTTTTRDGGLIKRKHPEQQGITNYILVAVGGPIRRRRCGNLAARSCMPKTAVPQMGYFAVLPGHREQHVRHLETNESAK